MSDVLVGFLAAYAFTLFVTGLFLFLLTCIIREFMRFLHAEFDWNPLSRRKQS
ncbi:hypothetical protein [Bifidobacterium platyrrhinorum]|uniref:hypothetical protein n=1 Tax=Bifidobacterium platyrrhinorum TaxID=2661628 RepID=UPI0013D1A64B|nr:hypothetical protein [Bifidobacterium platyrrhinorum]